jgi:hypothetical protein
MASSKGARVFGIVILLACIAVIAGGAWFFFGRDFFKEESTAVDDDSDDVEPGVDAGAHHARHPGKHRGKGAAPKAKGPSHPGAPGPTGPGGKSYEAAIAGNHEQISVGGAAGAPDLTDAQLGGPMKNGTFLGTCGTPDSMHVTVKVAIRSGHAVGVSVYTAPPDPEIAGCIDRQVRNLAWPVNGKMDSFVTAY